MLNLRRHLLAGVAGLALTIGGASGALAGSLILDPTATNNGQGAFGPESAFPTTSATLKFTSDLVIQSGVGAAGSINSAEIGSFFISAFQNSPSPLDLPGTGILSSYNLFADFTVSGAGTWGTDGSGNKVYTLAPGPGTVIGITLFGTTGTLNFADADAATGSFGITGNGTIENLGTFFVSTFGSATATVNAANTNTGALFLSTALASLLNTDFTGPGGFFNNVLSTGLNLKISSTNSTTPDETIVSDLATNGTSCTASDCTEFQTGLGAGAVGSLKYAVPEPTSLALLGSALLGLGVIRRRRNRKA